MLADSLDTNSGDKCGRSLHVLAADLGREREMAAHMKARASHHVRDGAERTPFLPSCLRGLCWLCKEAHTLRR